MTVIPFHPRPRTCTRPHFTTETRTIHPPKLHPCNLKLKVFGGRPPKLNRPQERHIVGLYWSRRLHGS